ncbi:MAG: molybdopterin-dependent oxidoreductase [Theionarchaea archaeon]|nr:molybdopterin-dependent oxidoreductase [Theionarchaea archaeon]
MKRILLFFLIFSFLCASCINQIEWTVYVIDDGIREYTLEDLTSFETAVIPETVIEKEIKKVKWEGVPAVEFGEGDIINFISEDGYMVSVPYGVNVIVAYKKEGKPISKEDGGPLKIAVDPDYGCKCNWLEYLKIVEFVDGDNSFSVYGEVFNLLTFSPRDLNLHYGLEDVLNNTFSEVPLSFVLDKAICKENATTVVFVTEEGRYSYSLGEILCKDLILVYDNGFHIYELGIENLKGIKIE